MTWYSVRLIRNISEGRMAHGEALLEGSNLPDP